MEREQAFHQLIWFSLRIISARVEEEADRGGNVIQCRESDASFLSRG